MTPPSKSSRRMLRGLIRHYRHRFFAPQVGLGRALITPSVSWADARRGADGFCRWCALSIGGEKRKGARWHSDCYIAYRIAVDEPGGVIGLDICECCGAAPATDIDHRLAISVARELGARAWMRAFTIDNLQGLCAGCHKDKSRVDGLLLRALKGVGRDIGYEEALRLLDVALGGIWMPARASAESATRAPAQTPSA